MHNRPAAVALGHAALRAGAVSPPSKCAAAAHTGVCACAGVGGIRPRDTCGGARGGPVGVRGRARAPEPFYHLR